MPNRAIQWSGHDLMPLPYESVLSCLLRLAWRNSLDERALKRHFSDQKNKFSLDLPSLVEQTKWYLDESRLRAFDEELRLGRSDWLTGQFRYCPICLECGYHCDLYQCTCLIVCPLHRTPLTTKCHHCGRATARYEVVRDLFRRPYYCQTCKGPISGTPPNLEAHLDLRAAAGELQAALQPYEAWWQGMAARRALVHRLRLDRHLDLQSKWCKPQELLRGAACKGMSVLAHVRPTAYDESEIVVLSWRYRIVLGNCADHFNRYNSWSHRVRIPTAVYRCTLRLLARWLARRHGWTDERMYEELDTYRGDDVSTYPVDLLAFLCLRWQLEARFSYDLESRIFPMQEAQLDDCPTVAMAPFHGRTPRLAWRAVFLAIYASWYGRVASSHHRDFTSLRNKIGCDGAYIFVRNRVCCRKGETWQDFTTFNPDEAWFEGEVTFLKIEDMPMSPWSN